MDQVEEKEENRFQEPTTDRCKEDKEQNNSEESSEVTTGLRAERIRPRPPGNPREGSGGNGGHHH
ncbi:hypothetical protein E2562_004307 [Oryza meyeriana var. granulata]|uniref:Uncharacterized protein n=1 Tax=Oryza meyeriana var. granulata TaxID=110450 RepID=A0A6G1BSH9_9ORYZ|nr:hypothetical protein E2562_004307 [Oryza meyeriana var. granulata]